jgi:CubicO group peptidase (beta-lactamase class C family)
MNELAMIWALAGVMALRVLMLIRFWCIPHTLVKGRFFGLPLEPSLSQPLLRRYHNALFICYLVDVCCALAVAVWGDLYLLLLEQVIAAVLARVCYSLIGIHFVRQAKLIAAENSWKPVRSVALMLTTRRLRDYVSLPFEVLLPLLTATTFALLTYLLWRVGEDDLIIRRASSFAVLALYLQFGGLLIKQALVKWRWRMPGQRVDEFQRWREAVLRYWLWVCDYFRCIFSLALLVFVLVDLLHTAGAHEEPIMLLRLAVAGIIILTGILGYERQHKRLKPLWESLRPLEDFSLPPETIDNREFFCGGICYFNAENPALFVPGPLVFAINLANRRTYLYAAYIVVLVSLGIWCGVAQPRAQGATESALALAFSWDQTVNAKTTPSPESLRELADGVRKIVEDDEAVGAEVLILHRSKSVLHEVYGFSDLDRRTPLKPSTIACIRSMTKPLVGTAIQMLVDEGKLSLAEPASKYLPAFNNEKSRAITIEQLLTHSAGFPLTRINKQLTAYSGQREVADQAGQLGPDGPPGQFRYSDCDSETLAAIVSAASGEPADRFLLKRILVPLAMKDTFLVLKEHAPDRSRVSSNHAGSPGMWHKYWDHEDKPFFPFFLGAASAYSTAEDYAKFLGLWFNRGQVQGKQLLSQAAIDRALKPAFAMLTPGTNLPYPTGLKPLRPNYGQHWMIYLEPDSKAPEGSLPVFGHGGSDGTLALVFPKQELVAFYFTQSRGGMSTFRFEELLAPLVGLGKLDARPRVPVEELRRYVASYREAGGKDRAWVTVQGQRLRLELPKSGALLLRWPDASGRWEFGEAQPGISVSFDRNPTGNVTGMKLWLNNQLLQSYERLPAARDLPTIEQIMQMRRVSHGGARIDELKNLELKGKVKIGAIEADNSIVADGLDRVVRRLVAPAINSTTVVDRGRAKRQITGQPAEELQGPFLEEALRMNPLARIRDWRDSFASAEVAGMDGQGDEEAWIIRLSCKFSPPITRYVNKKTGLLVREDSWVTAKGVGTVPLSIEFADYRDVAGVKIPFRLASESRVTGKQVSQFMDAKANAPMSEQTFALPKE